MILEGIVGKGYLELLKIVGYDFEFIIASEEDLIKYPNSCPTDMDFTYDAYVKIYTDMDIEETLLREDLILGLEKTQLALLINNPDDEIRELVEERVRE
jgi:hypothetical protein